MNEARTLSEWQKYIGQWAEDTFEHTPTTISAHLLEKAVKLHLSVTGIRERAPESDAAGILVLALTLLDVLGVSAHEELRKEMLTNMTASFAPDETGLSHRVAS